MRKAQTSMEYVFMVAAVLVIVVLVSFFLLTLYNKQEPNEDAVMFKLQECQLGPDQTCCEKYTANAEFGSASIYSTEVQCACYNLFETCTGVNPAWHAGTSCPDPEATTPGVCSS
ncbi:MAG: class III signal peptide-containing protein [Candidatus Micrarchaeota archaeon]